MKKAYKLFKISKGKLYPLFVDTNTEIPIGEWIEAKEGEKVEGKNKVKSKIGPLCFRPGFHLSDIPLAIHIGEKDELGNIKYMHKDHVWCEVEYDDAFDYQTVATLRGTNHATGKFNPKNAFLNYVPTKGYYRYKTSPNMLGEWIIAGNILVLRVLSDDEVAEILKEKGYEPMPRKDGPIDLKKHGF